VLDDAEVKPAPAVFARIAPNLCRIHAWLLPRSACDAQPR
jgi:hypothetical protein